ncbi:cystathionine gamma-synthase [Haematococcus lacustris]
MLGHKHAQQGLNSNNSSVSSCPTTRRICIARTAAKDRVVAGLHSGNGAELEHLLAPLNQDAMLPSTKSVHAGERAGRPQIADALTTPIVQTSTYWFKNTQQVIDFNEGRLQSHEYGRYGNPTVKACEDKIAQLEGAEDCLVSASGMSSVTTMLMALVQPGGQIITTSDCYWRTRQFMQNFLPKLNIGVSVIAPNDFGALQQCLDSTSATLFFSESPTNPYLRCVDINKISKMCHAKGVHVCIDSTFSTPINSKALEHGADLVLHSATKYLAGHNDVLAGALAGKRELIQQVRTLHHILGGVTDPHAAYLLLRGLKTLELRVERHNRSAAEIARRLQQHPKVERVWYPGLESHPDHAIARQQMGGYGGVVSFEVCGGLWDCARFIDAVRLPYIAPSLGGVESLIEMPAVQSYWGFGPEKRAAIGIKENLVRFSVGIEDLEDIWADLEQALDRV